MSYFTFFPSSSLNGHNRNINVFKIFIVLEKFCIPCFNLGQFKLLNLPENKTKNKSIGVTKVFVVFIDVFSAIHPHPISTPSCRFQFRKKFPTLF
jgi:hypothetical protein